MGIPGGLFPPSLYHLGGSFQTCLLQAGVMALYIENRYF